MKTALPIRDEPTRINLLRDQFIVVDRRGGDPDALKKAHAKMRRILKSMPMGTVDTVAEVRNIRDSGGRD